LALVGRIEHVGGDFRAAQVHKKWDRRPDSQL
jgi:hypothetical protein